MTISRPDADLLRQLGSVAAQADPVPPTVVELARLAWEMRSIDDELLLLVDDARSAPAGVRALGTATRLLTFEGADLVLELQLETHPPGRRLIGQILPVPAGATDVSVEVPGQPAVVAVVGDLGDFSVDLSGAGTFRVRVVSEGSVHVSTGWITP